MRKLLVFAQHSEAKETISLLGAQPTGQTAEIWSEGTIPNVYTFKEGKIVICSIGLHAAASAVAEHAADCDEVWNAGFAGSLQELPLLELVSIGKVHKYLPLELLDEHATNVAHASVPPLQLEGEHALLSSDFPIHCDTLRKSISSFQLIDMEGYAIAYAAKHLNKRCRMWKIVSDFASPGGVALIRKNKPKLSKRIAEVIEHESSRHH